MPFTRLLIAPPAPQIVAALLDGTRAANRDMDILSLDPGYLERFIEQMALQQEGRRQWSDLVRGETAAIGIAWWTDHVGRRHVMVRAVSPRDPRSVYFAPTRTDRRPPLWHIYPDHIYYRERQGDGEWWAVCDCGVVGRPSSIAWMGTTCGPCHDRAQEGPPRPDRGNLAPIVHFSRSLSPIFSADGTKIAVLKHEELVRVHDVSTGMYVEIPSPGERVHGFALSANGDLLAVALDGALTLHDLRTAERIWWIEVVCALSHLAFSPDSRFLAAGGPGVFHLWRLGQDPDNRQSIVSESRQVTALVFSPNSDRLAVAHPSGIEVFRVEQKGRISILENALLRHHVYNGLAFRDEQQLICLSYPDVLRLEDWTDIQIWDPIGGATTVLCLRMSTEAVTLVDRHELSCLVCRHLSPNGRWVAGIPFESNYVHLYDPITGDEIGRVTRDSQERPSHTVLSPDDRTLAVVDSIGEVKLIPWAALLL